MKDEVNTSVKPVINDNVIASNFSAKMMETMEDRIKQYGEVFTDDNEVNGILDLCEPVVSQIEKRVLEPSCGTGNFLVNVLNRKLSNISNLNAGGILREKMILQALASLYGIDIDTRNVQITRKRLRAAVLKFYKEKPRSKLPEDCIDKSVNLILKSNIQKGDMINGIKNLQFIEYEFKTRNELSRRSYRLIDLLAVDLDSLWGDYTPSLKEWPTIKFWELKDA